jgi:hypothetical protein
MGHHHVVGAEIFVDILNPGQGKTWTRRYEFLAPIIIITNNLFWRRI